MTETSGRRQAPGAPAPARNSPQSRKIEPAIGCHRHRLDGRHRRTGPPPALRDARWRTQVGNRAAPMLAPFPQKTERAPSRLASVPPEVNTTLRGSAPTRAATLSRAPPRPGRRTGPALGNETEDGLPQTPSASAAAARSLWPQGRRGVSNRGKSVPSWVSDRVWTSFYSEFAGRAHTPFENACFLAPMSC